MKTIELQHLEYFAFGETFVEEHSNKDATPYLYNAKELDEETGLYYYGARYYDPVTSVWQSVDPLAVNGRHLDARSNTGGVFDSKNNNVYSYVHNNPINAIDPDGKDVIILIAKGGAGGTGHMAALIQDGKGNWYYMTQGAADPNGNLSNMTFGGVQGGMALIPLNTKNKNEALDLAKQDTNNSEYTNQIELKTSSKMDAKIHKNAEKLQNEINSGEKKYNVITNNCVDAVQEPIEKGTGVSLPNDYDPRPNEYFEKLKNNEKKIQQQINQKIESESNKSKNQSKN